MELNRRVLVTRPQPGADWTAARLREAGFAPILLPLTEIHPLDTRFTGQAGDFAAVVATSANALRHADAGLIRQFARHSLFAVGDRTAQEARAAGFAHVRSAGGDARDLVTLISASLPRGARLLYLAGAERTPGFVEALHANGFEPVLVETYEAREAALDLKAVRETLGREPLHAVLLFSTRAATILAGLIERARLDEVFASARFLCISDKCAAPLRHFGARVMVGNQPSEEGVMLLLSADDGV